MICNCCNIKCEYENNVELRDEHSTINPFSPRSHMITDWRYWIHSLTTCSTPSGWLHVMLYLIVSIHIDYLLKSYMNMCQTYEDEDMMAFADLDHYSFELVNFPCGLSI